MRQLSELVWPIVLVGGGATLITDLWMLLLMVLGMPAMNFRMLGRWVGHMARGRVRHSAIAASPHIAGETAIGWAAHYAVGIVFAVLLVLVVGSDWLSAPQLAPAMLFGAATLVAPFLLMQPAMGAGFASLRTATPVRNIIKSTVTHLVFGVGLFLTASLLARISA
jgi:hypothetical protein